MSIYDSPIEILMNNCCIVHKSLQDATFSKTLGDINIDSYQVAFPRVLEKQTEKKEHVFLGFFIEKFFVKRLILCINLNNVALCCVYTEYLTQECPTSMHV